MPGGRDEHGAGGGEAALEHAIALRDERGPAVDAGCSEWGDDDPAPGRVERRGAEETVTVEPQLCERVAAGDHLRPCTRRAVEEMDVDATPAHHHVDESPPAVGRHGDVAP
jgi:hypothetical protein